MGERVDELDDIKWDASSVVPEDEQGDIEWDDQKKGQPAVKITPSEKTQKYKEGLKNLPTPGDSLKERAVRGFVSQLAPAAAFTARGVDMAIEGLGGGRPLEQFAQRAEALGETVAAQTTKDPSLKSWRDPRFLAESVGEAAGAGGLAIPALGTTVLAAAAGLPTATAVGLGTAAGAATMLPMAAGDVGADIEQATGRRRPGLAFAAGVPFAAVESVDSIMSFLAGGGGAKTVSKATKLLPSMGKGAAAGAFGEPAEEVVQDKIKQVAVGIAQGKSVKDAIVAAGWQDIPKKYVEYFVSMAPGMVVSGGLGGAAGHVQASRAVTNRNELLKKGKELGIPEIDQLPDEKLFEVVSRHVSLRGEKNYNNALRTFGITDQDLVERAKEHLTYLEGVAERTPEQEEVFKVLAKTNGDPRRIAAIPGYAAMVGQMAAAERERVAARRDKMEAINLTVTEDDLRIGAERAAAIEAFTLPPRDRAQYEQYLEDMQYFESQLPTATNVAPELGDVRREPPPVAGGAMRPTERVRPAQRPVSALEGPVARTQGEQQLERAQEEEAIRELNPANVTAPKALPWPVTRVTDTKGEELEGMQQLDQEGAIDLTPPTEEEMTAMADALDQPLSALDQAAHQAATSPLNEKAQPTPEQREKGAYEKGRVVVQGLPIDIENPKGSVREGKSKAGKTWRNVMKDHYGYVRDVKGKDGDKLDVFVGPTPSAETVFVVNQVDPVTGKFDEHKVMLGYKTQAEARRAYLANYEKGWNGLGSVVPMTVEEFKAWKDQGARTTPAAKQPPATSRPAKTAERPAMKGAVTSTPQAEPKGKEVIASEKETDADEAQGRVQVAKLEWEKSRDEDGEVIHEAVDDNFNVYQIHRTGPNTFTVLDPTTGEPTPETFKTLLAAKAWAETQAAKGEKPRRSVAPTEAPSAVTTASAEALAVEEFGQDHGFTFVDDPDMRNEDGRLIEGMYHQGKVTINVAAIADPARLRSVVREEGAHRRLSSEEGRKLLDKYVRDRLSVEALRKLQGDYPQAADESDQDYFRRIADEHIAKQYDGKTGAWKVLVQMTKEFLHQAGMINLTDGEVAQAILRAVGRSQGSLVSGQPRNTIVGVKAKGYQQIDMPEFSDIASQRRMKEISDAGLSFRTDAFRPAYVPTPLGLRRYASNVEMSNAIRFAETGRRPVVFKGKLADLVRHDELFARYPHLKKLDFQLMIDPTMPDDFRNGGFSAQPKSAKTALRRVEKGQTQLPRYITITAPNLDLALVSLAHELQHAVENHEDFSPGTSPQYMRSEREAELMRLLFGPNPGSIVKSEQRAKLTDRNYDDFSNYQRVAGEINARGTAARRTMTETERRAKPMYGVRPAAKAGAVPAIDNEADNPIDLETAEQHAVRVYGKTPQPQHRFANEKARYSLLPEGVSAKYDQARSEAERQLATTQRLTSEGKTFAAKQASTRYHELLSQAREAAAKGRFSLKPDEGMLALPQSAPTVAQVKSGEATFYRGVPAGTLDVPGAVTYATADRSFAETFHQAYAGTGKADVREVSLAGKKVWDFRDLADLAALEVLVPPSDVALLRRGDWGVVERHKDKLRELGYDAFTEVESNALNVGIFNDERRTETDRRALIDEVAAFHVRSMTELRGMSDEKLTRLRDYLVEREQKGTLTRGAGPTSEARFSLQPAPVYYSRLRNAVMATPTDKQGRATLDALEAKTKVNVDAEERKWTGFDEWLAEQKAAGVKSVALETVVQFLSLTPDNPMGSFRLPPAPPSAPTAAAAPDASPAAPAWDVSLPSRFEDLVLRPLQNKDLDIQAVVRAVEDYRGAQLPDRFDPYLKSQLYRSRTSEAVKRFVDKTVKPFINRVAEGGVTTAELDEFLIYRHAGERNTHIARVNPDLPALLPDGSDSGSGRSQAQIDNYFQRLDPNRRAQLTGLATEVDRWKREMQRILVDSGQETQETIDIWNQAYEHYVPFWREEFADDVLTGSGKGVSTRGLFVKRAVGSAKEVFSPLAAMAMSMEKAITRAEKARVSQAAYGLAIAAPNPDFYRAVDFNMNDTEEMKKTWAQLQAAVAAHAAAAPTPRSLKTAEDLLARYRQLRRAAAKSFPQVLASLRQLGLSAQDAENVFAEPRELYVDTKSGMVKERINRLIYQQPNALNVRLNGQDKLVIFNKKNERALEMVKGLKNLEVGDLGPFLGAAAVGTRWIAMVNTQYNPIFGVRNLVRDFSTAMLNLTSTPLAGEQLKVARYAGQAKLLLWQDARAERGAMAAPTGADAQLLAEFREDGGPTAYRNMVDSPRAYHQQLLDAFQERRGGSMARRLANGFLGVLADFNTVTETAFRFAAYKRAREMGMSRDRAALLAKDLTVNFDRRGQHSSQIGSLYVFFNASTQGTARLAQTMWDAKNNRPSSMGLKIAAGGLLLGALQSFLLQSQGVGEDDEPAQYEREKNFLIPYGDGKWAKIPMPLGFNILPNVGRITTEILSGRGHNTKRRAIDMAELFLDAFNPTGSESDIAQVVSPTLYDPILNLKMNVDWNGKPIAKQDFNPRQPTPGYLRTRDTATWFAKFMSKLIDTATGGHDEVPGSKSPTPDQIDYLIGYATGGAGREAVKAIQFAAGQLTGEEVPAYKTPLIGGFSVDTKDLGGQASAYYANTAKVFEAMTVRESRLEKKEGLAGLLQEYPEAVLISRMKVAEKRITELKKQKRKLIERKANKEAVHNKDRQVLQVMKTFNESVKLMRQNIK